jgi:type II secretory pathway component PulM
MSGIWLKLSPREQSLALITGGLIVLALVAFGVVRARGHLARLDDDIVQLETDVINMTRQVAFSESVDKEHAKIAEQHSSAWTAAEIRDKLRTEIRDLAEGVVTIPSLPDGSLDDTTEGYREYNINFKITNTKLNHLATFLRRLQESPQALRVDQLQLRRAPATNDISGSFYVARTVVDGAEEAVTVVASGPANQDLPVDGNADLARNGAFETWDLATRTPKEWAGESATLAPIQAKPVPGKGALKATVDGTAGGVFQHQDLTAGATYTLTLEATLTGAGQLGVRLDKDDADTGQPQALLEGAPHRYQVRFKVPGEAGSPVRMRVPYITLNGADSELILDNVVLKQVEG